MYIDQIYKVSDGYYRLVTRSDCESARINDMFLINGDSVEIVGINIYQKWCNWVPKGYVSNLLIKIDKSLTIDPESKWMMKPDEDYPISVG